MLVIVRIVGVLAVIVTVALLSWQHDFNPFVELVALALSASVTLSWLVVEEVRLLRDIYRDLRPQERKRVKEFAKRIAKNSLREAEQAQGKLGEAVRLLKRLAS